MEFICAKRGEEQSPNEEHVAAHSGKTRKYTYVLRSGRTLKVVVDDETEFAGTALSTPWFMVRMEDEAEAKAEAKAEAEDWLST